MTRFQKTTNTTLQVKTGRMVCLMCALVLMSLWFCPPEGRCAEVLDDSQSPKQTYSVQLKWAHSGNPAHFSRKDLQLLIADVPNVEVRLNTSRYVDKQVRIFLALPNQIDGLSSSDGFRLYWTTRGTLNAGTTTPGNRFLIYRGKLDSPQLIEFFSFRLEIDASRLSGELRYAPIYEIETF